MHLAIVAQYVNRSFSRFMKKSTIYCLDSGILDTRKMYKNAHINDEIKIYHEYIGNYQV